MSLCQLFQIQYLWVVRGKPSPTRIERVLHDDSGKMRGFSSQSLWELGT